MLHATSWLMNAAESFNTRTINNLPTSYFNKSNEPSSKNPFRPPLFLRCLVVDSKIAENHMQHTSL
jgi:hypothetical protein